MSITYTFDMCNNSCGVDTNLGTMPDGAYSLDSCPDHGMPVIQEGRFQFVRSHLRHQIDNCPCTN